MARTLLISIVLVFFSLSAFAADNLNSLEQQYLYQMQKIDKLGTDSKAVKDRNLSNENINADSKNKNDEAGLTEEDKSTKDLTDKDTENKDKEFKPEEKTKEVKVYGHELFKVRTDYVTDQNVNVPDNYILGTGDSVIIQFWGRVSKAENLVLDREGNIFSETLGKIKLGHTSYAESKTIIEQMTSSMEGLSATLTIDNTKTVKVLVSGSVNAPGYYIMNSFSNITQGVIAAEGVREDADIRNVTVLRDAKVIEIIDYYELINNGIYNSKALKFEPNDVIFVPRSTKRVKITGAVKEEAYYELKGKTTLSQSIALAGGLKANARFRDILLSRFDKNAVRYTAKSLNYNNPKDAGMILTDGDEIEVYEAHEELANSVELTGNVYFPGKYEYSEGMRISDILNDSSKVLEDTEINIAYVARKDIKTSEVKLIPFNLKEIFSDVSSEDNLMLQPNDKINIISRYDILESIEIEVSGEVVNPGKVKAEKDFTVYDLITEAGGFTSSSNIRDIEIITYEDGQFASEQLNISQAMAKKAPAQGFLVVHGIYENVKDGYVEVLGDVMNAGEYIYYNGLKLSDVLKKAISKDNYDNSYKLLYYRTSVDGAQDIYSITIDSLRDRKANLRLYKNDRIEVTLLNKSSRKYVSIEGAVYDKGQYIYGQGMTISNLITMAGGITDSAYQAEVEIIRKKIIDYSVDQQYIIVKKDEFNSFLLTPGDSVVVKNISDYNKTDYVILKGEFVFPGIYPIKKGERISSIIRRAGGFTEYAYLYGTKLTREKVRVEKQLMVDNMISRLERDLISNANVQLMTAASSDSLGSAEVILKTKDSFLESLKKIKADGRVVINMEHPRLLQGSVNDVVLENGDSVYVPKMQEHITVAGAVLNQGAFIYNKKMQWKDYVKIAGGLLNNADEDNIYIIKANGTVQRVSDKLISWSSENERWQVSYFSGKQILQPGDNIVVPDNYSRTPWLRNIKDVTQILMQIAVTGGIAANLY